MTPEKKFWNTVDSAISQAEVMNFALARILRPTPEMKWLAGLKKEPAIRVNEQPAVAPEGAETI